MTDETYFPAGDIAYFPATSMYREWLKANLPDPCSKYHVTVDENDAAKAAPVALAVLQDMNLRHKIVASRAELKRQNAGQSAGKFITVYAKENYEGQAMLIIRLSGALTKAQVRPGPAPRRREGGYKDFEPKLDPRGFIYGGYVTRPHL